MQDKEFIKILGGVLFGTMVAKRLHRKKGSSSIEDSDKLEKESLYMQGSGRNSDNSTAASHLLRTDPQLSAKYGEDIDWQTTTSEKIAILAPFITDLDPNKFYATMSRPISSFRNMSKLDARSFTPYSKPLFTSEEDGSIVRAPLWFAQGSEWIDWMAVEMQSWLLSQNYIYEITLSDAFIKYIKSPGAIIDFNRRYAQSREDSRGGIDWQKVIDNYAGIVISPYQWSFRLSYDWYYPWDVASGAVWNWEGIKDIKLVSKRKGYPDAPKVIFGGSFNEENKQAAPKQAVYIGGGGRAISIHRDKELKDKGLDFYTMKNQQKQNLLLDWIYPQLSEDKFYVTTHLPISSFRNMRDVIFNEDGDGRKMFGSKPRFKSNNSKGNSSAPLWFAPGAAWIDWMYNEMPDWLYATNYIYEIELNWQDIVVINRDNVKDFESKYTIGRSYWGPNLAWDKITKLGGGIYQTESLIDMWDVPSGCIWSWCAIKNFKLAIVNPNAPEHNPPNIINCGGSFYRKG